ncbi:GAF domain-containing sensor histidine kinase [Rubricoccus marinus]|uniref:histidine kinase n=1 Tax=Rubricoccus marinus TaxID=716817 RepID=A0A259TVR3_9BACT|nr:GAF domain-containing sensor histidine kinase [Rubricoccus marinus]OZC01796.1 hypothetical protein BSZ36_01610 [Rubricoccus marinus]
MNDHTSWSGAPVTSVDACLPALVPSAHPVPERTAESARLKQLLSINLALNTFGDTAQLLDVITNTVTGVADCDAASILLFDERSNSLCFEAASGEVGASLVGTTVPMNGSLAGEIFREGRPLYSADVQSDERHFRAADETTGFVTEALLGVPMHIDGQPVGVIEVLNSRHGGFDMGDVEALQIVAAQAAIAIRDARHARALVELNERLAEVDRLKMNFLAITSHELRTPLTSVRGFGQILADEVEGHLRQYADAIVRAGYRMTDVVQTLDVMATLEGEIGAHPSRRVDVSTILEEAIRGLAQRKNEIQVSFPHGLTVAGDGLRLRLVFSNLLKNAVRFSPAGAPVRVKGSVEGETLHVRVTDEGCGLARHNLERIFEGYVQLQDPDRRDHEGLGVGLTVARAVAVRHGGQLWAESDGPGCGSTFHLVLPLLL